jgi:hypothetical protein
LTVLAPVVAPGVTVTVVVRVVEGLVVVSEIEVPELKLDTVVVCDTEGDGMEEEDSTEKEVEADCERDGGEAEMIPHCSPIDRRLSAAVKSIGCRQFAHVSIAATPAD